MMAALFALFALAILFAWIGLRKTAIVVALFNLAFCLLMLWYHAATTLQIRL